MMASPPIRLFSGNDCTTTSAGVIPHDGVTGYIGFLGGDSIVRNPALSFLTEIFLRLDETAKISRMDILTNIPQGPEYGAAMGTAGEQCR